MNRAVCITTWREFKSNKVRIVMLFLLITAPLLQYTWQRCQPYFDVSQELLTPAPVALAFTLLWGAGAIGREVQHGTISLVLARPISIVTYVLSKWFAVGLAASVCAVQAVLIEHLISAALSPALIWQTDFISNAADRVVICFGAAAFLIFLTSLVSGLKDLAVLAGILFALSLSSTVCTITQYVPGGAQGIMAEQLGHLFAILGMGIMFILYPNVPIANIIGGNYNDILNVLYYVTTICCFLSLSIFVLTRKEYSYAAE